jgi:general secretion pathway protein C
MTPRQARLGLDVFTGVVVASVALALANVTWRLTGEPGIGPAAAPIVARRAEQVDVEPLVALAPFGTTLAVASTSTSDGSVRLKAVFLARPIEASVVLLATADGQVATYGLGAAVAGGVIERIEAEQIVLRTPSGLQTIGFNPQPGPAAPGAPMPGAPLPAPSAPQPPAPLVQVPARPVPAAPVSGAAAVRALIPPSVQGIAAPSAAPAPNAPAPSVRSSQSGYVVGPSLPPALRGAGIQPGDVIQRVNGTAVAAAVNERDLMARAMAGGTARVELVRNGRALSITIPVP